MDTSQQPRQMKGSKRFLVVGIAIIFVAATSMIYDRSLMSTYRTNLPTKDSPRTAINRTATLLATQAFTAPGGSNTEEAESALDLLVEEAWEEEQDEAEDENEGGVESLTDTGPQQQHTEKDPSVIAPQQQQLNVARLFNKSTASAVPPYGVTQQRKVNATKLHNARAQNNDEQQHHHLQTPPTKNGFKFYILRVPNMTTALITNNVEMASRIYKEDINEASAEVWLHRGMASLTYEQGQTMDPNEADVFLIPGYLRLRAKLPQEDKVDMYQEVMNAVVDKSKPHIWMSPTENPGVCRGLGVTDLVNKIRMHLKDYYSLGLERNSAWSGGVTVDRIIPVPYVLRPNLPPDQLASSFSHNRTENFVFFRADRRRMAQGWAGCDRAIVEPLFGRSDMDIGLSGKMAPKGGGGRLSQEQYNHRMSTSDYCLVMCGDTPTTRSLVSAVIAGCIPILVGRWWHGLCDPPCNRVWGWDVANLPHFPFADQIDWHLMPVATHSQFEKDPNATLTALFQQYPKHRKDKIRAEMKRVQKWLVYGWGDPVTSNVFGDVYTHIWESILHHVGLQSAIRITE